LRHQSWGWETHLGERTLAGGIDATAAHSAAEQPLVEKRSHALLSSLRRRKATQSDKTLTPHSERRQNTPLREPMRTRIWAIPEFCNPMDGSVDYALLNYCFLGQNTPFCKTVFRETPCSLLR
jgi:hypothetical protein